MRRAFSALIMGVSLLVASATWAGFVLTRTILDPGRSERLADHVLEDEEIRQVIIDRLADSIEGQIPTEVPVSRDTIEQAAARALDDPRVESLIRDGIVQTHQNALNGVDQPVTLDAGALGEVGREAVVGLSPELDAVLPPAPPLALQLPDTGLSWLGTVREQALRFTRLGAMMSVIGMVTAFVLSRNRPKTLRRVSYWAFGAAAFWLLAAFAVPWLLEQIAPSTASIATATVDVFFGAMVTPALIMAGIGAALLVTSMIWPAVERRRPAARIERARPARAPRSVRPSTAPSTPPGWRPESRPAARPRPGAPEPAGPLAPLAPAGYQHRAPSPALSGYDHEPTASFPVIVSRYDQDGGASGPDPDATVSATLPGSPRWEPGVGYVDEYGRPTDEHGRPIGDPGYDPNRTVTAGERPEGQSPGDRPW